MWSGHPRGTYLLCTVELLERTSYYGLRAVLVLLMVAAVADGGLGWSETQALAFYGVFTGAIWCSPLIGGLITDRWVGLRLAVPLGGCLLVLGYLSLFASQLIPLHVYVLPGVTLRDFSAAAGLSLGRWADASSLAVAVDAAIAQLDLGAISAATAAATIGNGLQMTSLTFLGGLGLVVLGNGFFKPSITVMVGELYRAGDPARERAYLLFYMAIYAGVLAAGVGVGTAGERFGWATALAVALIAMVAAFCAYLARRAAALHFFEPEQSHSSSGTDDRPSARDAFVIIAVHALFAMVFWAAYEQSGGLLNLFILEQVDRRVGMIEVPTTWFFSLTAVVAILLGPALSRLIERWEFQHRPLQIPERFAIGLLWGALAFALMTLASVRAQTGLVSILWPLAFYVLLTIGELVFSPTGFAMVGRLAPRRHQSGFMGLWLLSIACGSYIGGQVGALSHTWGRTTAFAGLAAAMVVSSAILLMSRPVLRRFGSAVRPAEVR